MKKYCFSILAVLLVGVLLFSGCTKSNSAKLSSCASLYEQAASKYGVDEENGKTIIYDGNKNVDLKVGSSITTPAILSAVNSNKATFVLLKDDGVYQTMLKGATNLFELCKYLLRNSDAEGKVSQDKKSNLYVALEDLDGKCKNLSNAKDILESFCANGISDEKNEYVAEYLNDFLHAYGDFIGQSFKISVAFDEMFENLFSVDATSVDGISMRLFVARAQLFSNYYLYQKHLVYLEQYTSNFKDSTDASYDKTFDEISKINTENAIKQDNIGVNEKFYFKEGQTKLKSFKTDLKNYITATNKLNHQTSVEGKGAMANYLEYVNSFDSTAQNFVNYINSHFIVA